MEDQGAPEGPLRLRDFDPWFLLMLVLGGACLIAFALIALIAYGNRVF